jgi:1,4-alpha-glucan branching enzyme
MYPYQHDAERKMTELADRYAHADEIEKRVLNQLARELLLAQSSDWAFQIYQGTTVQYSSRRFQSHIHRFSLLAKMLETGDYNEPLLAEIEWRDNIFAEIDYRVYRSARF